MKNDYEIRGDTTAIFLKYKNSTILEAIIDTSDLPKLMAFPVKWYARWNKRTKSFYATARAWDKQSKKHTISAEMHRFILDAPKGMLVDHINHNTLDNRRSNLRLVNNSQNMQNRKGNQRNNTSGYRGVSWQKSQNKWRARVTVNKKTVYLKYFDNLEDAVKAVKEARAKMMPCSEEALKELQNYTGTDGPAK